MTGIEPQTSGIGSDRSAYWATGTAPYWKRMFVSFSMWRKADSKLQLNSYYYKIGSFLALPVTDRLCITFCEQFLDTNVCTIFNVTQSKHLSSNSTESNFAKLAADHKSKKLPHRQTVCLVLISCLEFPHPPPRLPLKFSLRISEVRLGEISLLWLKSSVLGSLF